MGNLIFFEDHHPGLVPPEFARQRLKGSSLIPVQLALNEYDIETCFSLLASYGRCSIYPRANPSDEGRILFLVCIDDAIALNRFLLEQQEQAQTVTDRIDLIQMLENCEQSLLSKAWDRIGLDCGKYSPVSGKSVSHVRQ